MTVQSITTGATAQQKTLLHDGLTAAAFLALGVGLLAFGVHASDQYPVLWPATAEQLHWWHTVPLALAAVATCMQTRYPVPVYVVVTGLVIIDMTMGLHLAVLLVWAHAVYNVARYTSGKLLRWSLAGFCLFVFGWIFGFTGDLAAALSAILQVVLIAVISLWWGSEVRGGYERAEAERLQSLAARRREEQERQELLRRQRADLATQLHDTISSHLSTIALYTAGTLDMPREAERDQRVLTEIRATSLAALTEMRELIDVLRSFTDGDSSDPVPEPVPMAELLRRLRSAGLDLTITDDTLHELNALADHLDPAAANLVTQVLQEALTNALKHGDGTATLHIERHDEHLTCIITNPIGSAASQTQKHSPGLSGGLGLGAMAAAIDDAGGCFSAGAHAEADTRYWSIRVQLPTASTPQTTRMASRSNPT